MAKASSGKTSSSSKSAGGRARSAVSGEFVTKDYAKSHPKTTVTERTSKPASKKK